MVGAVPHADRGRAPGRVLERVGQALLHHPVGGEPDGVGQVAPSTLLRPLHRLAGPAGLVDEVAHAAEDRRPLRRGRLARGLEHAQQVPELRQGASPGAADRDEPFGGAVGCRVQEVLRGVGLHDHRGHVVRHDVVQVPRDPGALLSGRDGGRETPTLDLLGPPATHSRAGRPDHHQDEVEREEHGQPVGRTEAGQRGREDDVATGHHGGDDPTRPRQVGPGGVQRHVEADARERRRAGQHLRRGEGGTDDGEADPGYAAAERERQALREGERHRQRVRRPLGQVTELDADRRERRDEPEHCEGDRERRVQRVLPSRSPPSTRLTGA